MSASPGREIRRGNLKALRGDYLPIWSSTLLPLALLEYLLACLLGHTSHVYEVDALHLLAHGVDWTGLQIHQSDSLKRAK